jgi:hypothetical protein
MAKINFIDFLISRNYNDAEILQEIKSADIIYVNDKVEVYARYTAESIFIMYYSGEFNYSTLFNVPHEKRKYVEFTRQKKITDTPRYYHIKYEKLKSHWSSFINDFTVE